jgi:hypothetical protein
LPVKLRLTQDRALISAHHTLILSSKCNKQDCLLRATLLINKDTNSNNQVH